MLAAPARHTQYRRYEIVTRWEGGKELSLMLNLWVPPDAAAEPYPVLLDIDGCWRYFNDDVIMSVLERGSISR